MAVNVATANDVLKFESATHWVLDHNEHLEILTADGETVGTVNRNEWLSVFSSEATK